MDIDATKIDLNALNIILATSKTLASLILPETGDTYANLDVKARVISRVSSEPRCNLIEVKGAHIAAHDMRFAQHNLVQIDAAAQAVNAHYMNLSVAPIGDALDTLVKHKAAVQLITGSAINADNAKAVAAAIPRHLPNYKVELHTSRVRPSGFSEADFDINPADFTGNPVSTQESASQSADYFKRPPVAPSPNSLRAFAAAGTDMFELPEVKGFFKG